MINDNVRFILEGDIIVVKVFWGLWIFLLKRYKEK